MLVALRLLAGSLVLTGCIAAIPDNPPGAPPVHPPPVDPPDPTHPELHGLIVEPSHGGVVDDKPETAKIHVAGEYEKDGATISVEVLDDPNDLTSWHLVGQALVGGNHWETDVEPVAIDGVAQRWPDNGILRMRVLDEAGTPLQYDPDDPEAIILAVAQSRLPPFKWRFLEEKPDDFFADATAYYNKTGAPTTLQGFINRYGMNSGTTDVSYYNNGDLGIGREMHCKKTTNPAGGMACYVRNYGNFSGNEQVAMTQLVLRDTPLATVCMVYAPPVTAPNAVSFVVYGADDNIATSAQLDINGNNQSIPQNCINCHGAGSAYNAQTREVTYARFLPFDPDAFHYASIASLSFDAQKDKFKEINTLMLDAGVVPATTEVINGMFPADYDPDFVPAAWATKPADARVYKDVIKPYCRSCHVTEEGPRAFATPQDVIGLANSTIDRVCGTGNHGMPAAQQTALKFFKSGARAELLTWLGMGGACTN